MITLTPKQKITLVFICKHIDKNHIAPSLSDIAKKFNVSVTAAQTMRDRMKEKGLLDFTPKTSHSLYVTEAGRAAIGL